MQFCYFDESGDSGYAGGGSPSLTFTLASVLIDDSNWLAALDQGIAFRRYLNRNFGIPPRMELKANWLVRGKGPIGTLGLAPQVRLNVYRAIMRFQRKSGLFRTFAVVINKNLIADRSQDPREICWRYAIQRLERYGNSTGANLHVLPDEGHGYFIRRKIRQMRRFNRVPSAFSSGTLTRDATNIIEDSSERQSHESIFIQFADFNAYAAFRKVHPVRSFDGSFWDLLGNARISEVNTLRGGPDGIVSWP